ncbi:DUF5686 and carboxypeptidase regulatory-like domain-containing protein [Lacihabitans sp. LS3-19]|uniref:DUF5686 and carboxypeptidase regulatory-like domain-containing protein n=1 Tax=Lacihabitans sp. LS3-19 TaxID=2487335 RepID=UPI0020CEA9C3|nr:DUF5686 and carboxypeptidase regulatory-like domain-containing protein [Lacihabitans sp. LS3-19]
MIKFFLKNCLTFLLLYGGFSAHSQNYFSLKGFVYTEQNEPLVGATIRVVNLNLGTSTDAEGKYEMRIAEGLNRISVSYTAYQTEIFEVVLDADKTQNILMKVDQKLLDELVVKVKKRDFSYDVIKNVIANKQAMLTQYENYESDVYILSTERTNSKVKLSKKEDEPDAKVSYKDTLKINLFEAKLKRNEDQRGHQKEVKSAVKIVGDQSSLFYKSITDGEYNLYKNTEKIKKIGDNAILSPFSDLAILSYKFELLSFFYDGADKIYKIKVSPKKLGNALYEGEVEIIDGIWVVRSCNLSLTKKALLLYDSFRFEQKHEKIADRWMPTETKYFWTLKEGKSKKEGKAEVIQSNFLFDQILPKRFFGLEVGLTEEEAYKKDSTFWEAIRPKPLDTLEQAAVVNNEKMLLLKTSKVYLDSIDKIYNKLTFPKLVFLGWGHINRYAKKDWFFNPIISVANPFSFGGWRINYGLFYKKVYENRKSIQLSPNLNFGLLNKDLRGNVFANFYYNPKRVSSVSLRLASSFNAINNTATIRDIARRSNFYESKIIAFSHRTELFNGFYLNSFGQIEDRNDLSDFKFGPLGDKLFNGNKPEVFPESRIYKTGIGFTYTPKQLFLREPNEKKILGSKFPTFGMNIEKAWPNKNASSFTYLSAQIYQSVGLGIFGVSEYRINAGKFLDTTRLAIMDYKYQRGGDSYFFSPAMSTFQLIPQTFATFDWFFESHYQHQFNGFFTSKIPLLNKTKIREVAGAGFLYVPERKYQYSELYFGFNRVFNIARFYFRVGGYYVVGQSNDFGLRNMFKFSFEPYNRNNNSWSF